MSEGDFFSNHPRSKELYDRLRALFFELGEVETRITKSQIAFVRDRSFAWAWIPEKYLKGKTASLVLSIAFNRPDDSRRWKEVVEPAPGRFMHHLEVNNETDLDDEVRGWLQEAWNLAKKNGGPSAVDGPPHLGG